MYVHGKHREKSNNNSSIIHAKAFLLITCTNTYLQNSNGIFLPEFWVMRDNGRHAGEVVSFHFLQRRKFILGAQVHHIGKPPESKQGLRQQALYSCLWWMILNSEKNSLPYTQKMKDTSSLAS